MLLSNNVTTECTKLYHPIVPVRFPTREICCYHSGTSEGLREYLLYISGARSRGSVPRLAEHPYFHKFGFCEEILLGLYGSLSTPSLSSAGLHCGTGVEYSPSQVSILV